MEKRTLITGASKGLGLEFAKLFAKDKNPLLLVSSNLARLKQARESILNEIPDANIDIFEADLSNIDDCKKVFEYTKEKDYFINNLANCAGFGDRNDFKDMDIDFNIKLNNLNINATLYFTRVFLDNMLKENEGQIINIASIAGFVPGPYMMTYHASKSYIVSMGYAVARELRNTNVHIFTLSPGPFESNFVKVAGNDYTFSKIKPVPASKVAEYGYKMAKKHKVHKIYGFKNKVTCFAPRFFTLKFVTAMSGNTLKDPKEQK